MVKKDARNQGIFADHRSSTQGLAAKQLFDTLLAPEILGCR
jgi:hypothetical protein